MSSVVGKRARVSRLRLNANHSDVSTLDGTIEAYDAEKDVHFIVFDDRFVDRNAIEGLSKLETKRKIAEDERLHNRPFCVAVVDWTTLLLESSNSLPVPTDEYVVYARGERKSRQTKIRQAKVLCPVRLQPCARTTCILRTHLLYFVRPTRLLRTTIIFFLRSQTLCRLWGAWVPSLTSAIFDHVDRAVVLDEAQPIFCFCGRGGELRRAQKRRPVDFVRVVQRVVSPPRMLV